jgi:hypothetical protein
VDAALCCAKCGLEGGVNLGFVEVHGRGRRV